MELCRVIQIISSVFSDCQLVSVTLHFNKSHYILCDRKMGGGPCISNFQKPLFTRLVFLCWLSKTFSAGHGFFSRKVIFMKHIDDSFLLYITKYLKHKKQNMDVVLLYCHCFVWKEVKLFIYIMF